MWGVTPRPVGLGRALKAKIAEHGVRNSLLLAPMPTASTAQILGNNECFEPYTSNMYSRRVLSGEFAVVNQHLLRDLMARGLWTATRSATRSSRTTARCRTSPRSRTTSRTSTSTVWEMKQRALIDMAADRAARPTP